MDKITKEDLLPIVNLGKYKLNKEKYPLEVVDDLADELASEFNNADYRSWYASIIIEFGIPKILEWRSRARTSPSPGKIFTTYANQAKRKVRGNND